MARKITEMQILSVELQYKDADKDVDIARLVAASQIVSIDYRHCAISVINYNHP